VQIKNLLLVANMMFSVQLAACAGRTEDEQTEETSQALGSSEADFEYYSDDTYTNQVGFFIRNCSGQSNLSGRRTSFVIGSQTSCHTNTTVGCWQRIDDREVCNYDACVNCF
jgi:hypothetical protein